MNKKIVLLGITIIIFLIVGLGLISNKQDSNNESNSYKLKEYNSDIVCTLDVEATEDEEAYTSYVYIYNNDGSIKWYSYTLSRKEGKRE